MKPLPADDMPHFGSNGDLALVLPTVEQYPAVMAFSLRPGGCSPPPFDSLNFSVAQGDASENVQRNLATLCVRLRLKPSRIATCRQVHGDDIAVLDSVPTSRPDVDAIVTRVPGLYPSVKTADCVPILVLDPVERVSAAIHAGWRGTVKRITRKVLRLMQSEFGTNPRDVIAALGPAIGSCCYEVDDVVLGPFRRHVPDADRFIQPVGSEGASGERGFLDLVGANQRELLAEGVSERNIYPADLCTCCTRDILFSYRRDGARSGRHIAVVGFRG